jgi:hypothetical protein
MDGPARLVRNSTQPLASSPLPEKAFLLSRLHECNLKILQGTYIRISAQYQNREDFADVVKDFKDEVIKLRLWGKEMDDKNMLVVENSKELRSAVAVLLQEIAFLLLNRNLAQKYVEVRTLIVTDTSIRPPLGWYNYEYGVLKKLYDIWNTGNNQTRDHSASVVKASPDIELFGLGELILDLRCYTSTLMDLVPVIEHTKDVLDEYVCREHVSRIQQTKISVPQAQSAQDDKTKVEALEKMELSITAPSSFKSSTISDTLLEGSSTNFAHRLCEFCGLPFSECLYECLYEMVRHSSSSSHISLMSSATSPKR